MNSGEKLLGVTWIVPVDVGEIQCSDGAWSRPFGVRGTPTYEQ